MLETTSRKPLKGPARWSCIPAMGRNLRREYNAISLFSGGGGLDLGAEAAGFTTRVCIDNDQASCETLMLNRNRPMGANGRFLSKANIICKEIRNISAEEILDLANLKRDEVDLVYGGPPCQAFSVFGRRKGMEDPRGTLLLEFVSIIHDLQPKMFFLENVPGLETIGGGKVYGDLVEMLKKKTNGGRFDVKHFILDVCDYGVPQRRKRIIMLGSRLGKPITEPTATYRPKMSIMTYGQEVLQYNTVGDALEGLPPANSGKAPNHETREHSDSIKKRYAELAFGERDSKTRINKLDPTEPSFTIIVGSENGGGKGHVHPYEPREVKAPFLPCQKSESQNTASLAFGNTTSTSNPIILTFFLYPLAPAAYNAFLSEISHLVSFDLIFAINRERSSLLIMSERMFSGRAFRRDGSIYA